MINNFVKFTQIKIFKSKKFYDNRGCFEIDINFLELKKKFKVNNKFIQINRVVSKKNVLRGIHYQISPYQQSKIIYVSKGKILDVVVDLRKNSKTYGKYYSTILSKKNSKKIYIPNGFGHAYKCLSKNCEVIYLTSGKYSKKHSRFIKWNDKNLAIKWGQNKKVILSKNDKDAKNFK